MNINQEKLQGLLDRFVSDLGATMSAGTVVIGEKLGLYRAMRDAGKAVTPAELAGLTGTSERYVREWLNSQAASGYVEYDAAGKSYFMTDEQTLIMTDGASPVYLPGAFVLATAALKATPKVTEKFKTGEGLGWHEHDHDLFCGTEMFFRSGYGVHLINEWIPALNGVKAKLQKGAKVADIGCGHGASTILMAQAFPNSEFYGFDYHDESIETARRKAVEAGVAERVFFEVAAAKNFPGNNYDLVAAFDSLHDMGDPVGTASHVKKSLKEDGSWLIVEPFAGDTPESNHNPVGRVFYSGSTLICTPASLSQEVGLALGAQAGEERLRKVVKEGGFSSLTRATETPFNLILEAKP